MKAIVFDFDGTMIDTENLWYKVTMDYIKETYQIELPAEIYQSIIGTSEEPLHKYMMEQTNGAFDAHAFTTYVSNYLHDKRQYLELRPGFKRVFNYAVDQGFKIGLATSSSREWVVPILKKFELYDAFTTIQTADDVRAIKPDPSLYKKAVQEIGSKEEETFAVEDSLNGAKSALRAGLKVVVVPNEATRRIAFPSTVTKFAQFDDIDLKKVFQ